MLTRRDVAPDFPKSPIPAANVASVPRRSPLRYPGGKTWLIPHVRAWLGGRPKRPPVLFEPFAGGATVSLTAVMEDLVDAAVLADTDDDVAAFWRAALHLSDPFVAAVREFEPTRKTVRAIAGAHPLDDLRRGFRTLVLNRTRRGGTLAPGAGIMRSGEGGRGVASRWYPETLASRLEAIAAESPRLGFLQADGMILLEQRVHPDAAVFVDPPYTAPSGKRAGRRLYSRNEIDHRRLFWILADRGVDFLMTCDDAPEIRDLVRRHGFAAVRVEMKTGHHARVEELVITRNPVFGIREEEPE